MSRRPVGLEGEVSRYVFNFRGTGLKWVGGLSLWDQEVEYVPLRRKQKG